MHGVDVSLSKNFTLSELTASQFAERHGINNAPSEVVVKNLKETANQLEKVRALLGSPIYISSGYRSPTLNRSIGGSSTSAHCLGFAVDFTSPSFGSPKDIVAKIMNSEIKYDQLIHEGTWVHISFAPAMRRQTLIATFKNGKATYRNY
jgi:putative chitinase